MYYNSRFLDDFIGYNPRASWACKRDPETSTNLPQITIVGCCATLGGSRFFCFKVDGTGGR